MGRKTEAILEQIADVVVNNSQSCIASAIASVDIDISGAKEVVIDGMEFNSTVKTSVEDCESSEDIDVGLIQTKVNERMDEIVNAADSMTGDEVKLKVGIQDLFEVNNEVNCTALAIATTTMKFANVENRVTFKDVEINQVATAAVKKCVSNLQVRVGDSKKPLRNFLQEFEDGIEVTPLKGGKVSPDGKPLRGKGTCTSMQEADAFLKKSVIGSLALVVLVALVISALYYTD